KPPRPSKAIAQPRNRPQVSANIFKCRWLAASTVTTDPMHAPSPDAAKHMPHIVSLKRSVTAYGATTRKTGKHNTFTTKVAANPNNNSELPVITVTPFNASRIENLSSESSLPSSGNKAVKTAAPKKVMPSISTPQTGFQKIIKTPSVAGKITATRL